MKGYASNHAASVHLPEDVSCAHWRNPADGSYSKLSLPDRSDIHDGGYRPHQPAVRGLVLGHGARPAVHRQAGQPAGRLPAAAGRPDAARAHRHADRRERRGDRLRALRPGRHRRGHRDERPAVPHEGDPRRAEESRGFTVVGGPLVTVEEDYFDGLADVIFIGEAEETWPQFLREWEQGLHQDRYEQVEKSDMAKVPTPRFDLLKMRH